jgi:hypothetical protein
MPMREWDEMWWGDEMWWNGRTCVSDGLKLDELILLLKYWYMQYRKPVAKYFRIARSLFLFSTKAHRCWPWPAHIWWCAVFLTCSNNEVRRIRWSCSYAQVWFSRWSLRPLSFYTNSNDCRGGGAFTCSHTTTILMKTREFPLDYNVIGVLTSVVKLCNL